MIADQPVNNQDDMRNVTDSMLREIGLTVDDGGGKVTFAGAEPVRKTVIKADADGSTTIYIQADSPGKDKESNWLPAPKEPFYLLLRMYLPKIEVLNGQYEIPGVQLVR